MKKIFLFASAVVAMLAAGSCQKEVEFLEGDTMVKFEVSAGDVATKAIADASNITVLHWELYGTDIRTAAAPYGEGKVVDQDGDKNFTVELRLVADQDYNIVFWAETEDGQTHYETSDLRNVKIRTYGDESANDEGRAAFFGVHNFQTENGVSVNEQVTLYRPFAQINLGTTTYVTDLNQINGGQLVVNTTEMTVSKIANIFSTLDGIGVAAPDFDGVVTFAAAATPNGDADQTDKLLTVNSETYYWIGMNYLIVQGDSDAIDVDVVLNTNMGEITHSVANVPVKENYRTNILGDFLTTGATFEIVVDEKFQTPEIILGQAWSHLGDFKYVINEGAPAGTLKAVLAEADAEARALATKAQGPVVTIDLASDVDWVTEASHGSSPLLPAESPISEVIINGNGKTLTATGAGVGSIRLANGGVLRFNNVNIVDESVSYAENAWEFTYLEFAGLLSFKDCTFNSGVQFQAEEGGSLVASFEGCDFISNEASVYAAWVSDGVTSFEGCTFKGTRGLKIHEDYGSEVTRVEVDGCEFGPMSKKPGIAFGTLNAETTVIVKNSLFTDCQAGDQGLYMYETDTDVESFDFTRQNNTVISATEPVVQEDGSVIVACASALQKAVDAAAEGTTVIKIAADIAGDVVVTQKPNVNIVLEGAEKNYEGVITVDGKSATYTTAGLTVKNLTFNAEAISADACIRLGDGTNATRYTCNVTVEGCTFAVPGAVGIKSYTGGDKSLTVKGCTATAAAHSLLQAKGIDGVLVEGCTINSKNGMNFNNSTNVTVNNCNADVRGYAARFGEGSAADTAAETYAITDSTLKSACEDGDAVIILRGTAANSTLTITNTTLVGTTEIANNAVNAQVIR